MQCQEKVKSASSGDECRYFRLNNDLCTLIIFSVDPLFNQYLAPHVNNRQHRLTQALFFWKRREARSALLWIIVNWPPVATVQAPHTSGRGIRHSFPAAAQTMPAGKSSAAT